MRIDIMTLFPTCVDTMLSESIIGRAREAELVEIHCHNIRDHSEDKHHRVDDTPYGGGMGMLMSPVPIYNCYKSIVDSLSAECEKRKVIYMSPAGTLFDHKKALELSELDELIILCGHYEGVDERILEEIVDEEISIGDYVLTGGELPACVVTDSVCRLLPGVLASPECYEKESIASGMLEYPQYTRPYEFHGKKVPEVLISGHHANIEKWREEKAKEKTARVRPELLTSEKQKEEK